MKIALATHYLRLATAPHGAAPTPQLRQLIQPGSGPHRTWVTQIFRARGQLSCGDLNPNNTCTKTTIQPLAEAVCDVFGQDVHFTTVSLLDTDRQATFLLNVATLNIRTTTGPDACGGDSFWVRARFDLPEFNRGCCSGPDTLARLDTKNQFNLLDAAFFENESHLSGFADVRLKRVNNQASGNRLQIHISGTFQNGSSYTSLGLVHLACP